MDTPWFTASCSSLEHSLAVFSAQWIAGKLSFVAPKCQRWWQRSCSCNSTDYEVLEGESQYQRESQREREKERGSERERELCTGGEEVQFNFCRPWSRELCITGVWYVSNQVQVKYSFAQVTNCANSSERPLGYVHELLINQTIRTGPTHLPAGYRLKY